MRSDYRRWLKNQEYSSNTVNTQHSHVVRLEHAYGDLEQLYKGDGLRGLMESLRYSSSESRRGAPNPSKIQINGDFYKSLASFRTAAGLYARFLGGSDAGVDSPGSTTVSDRQDLERRERLGLERDLQKALRREIAQLEEGLQIIDDGVERAVPSGFIDITARDSNERLVVIELKAGESAARVVANLELRSYSIRFRFDER
ncbi:MAG: endonuclease NucS [Sphingomonadales bacterium]|nr:endonuclease NucS [Sphingomonadales bacterium]